MKIKYGNCSNLDQEQMIWNDPPQLEKIDRIVTKTFLAALGDFMQLWRLRYTKNIL